MNLKKVVQHIYFFVQKIENMKKWILILMICPIIGSLFDLGMAHGLRTLIQFASTSEWNYARKGLVIFLISMILAKIYWVINPLILAKFSQTIQRNIRKKILENVLINTRVFINEKEKGNYLETILNDTKKVTTLIIKITKVFIEYPVTAGIIIIYLVFTANITLLFLGIIISGFSWFIANKFSKSIAEVSKSERLVTGHFTQFVKELFENLELWKFGKALEWVVSNNRAYHDKIIDYRVKIQKTLRLSNIFQQDVAFIISRFFILSVGSILVLRENASAGDLIAFIFLYDRIVEPFQSMFNFLNQFNAQIGSLEQVLSFYNLNGRSDFRKLKAPNKVKSLKLENFEIYIYNQLLLKIEEMNFERGSIFCIQGENGFGKTTLINTLLGHHDNFRGSVYIDDVQLDILCLEKYRSFFSDTIQENIIMNNDVINHNYYSF